MEYENKYASKGIGGTALGLSIGALGVEALRGGFAGILGGGNVACAGDHPVNRYEAEKNARIAELETEVKLRDANTFTMGEMNKLRDYFDGRINVVEHELCDQRVFNSGTMSNISCLQSQVAQLMSLSKLIIPASNICPSPMPQYNSWTAPTTTT